MSVVVSYSVQQAAHWATEAVIELVLMLQGVVLEAEGSSYSLVVVEPREQARLLREMLVASALLVAVAPRLEPVLVRVERGSCFAVVGQQQ